MFYAMIKPARICKVDQSLEESFMGLGLEPAITTRLLLVRHGQTHTSRDDTFCGVTEVQLTAIGHAQAQCLAERLRREHVDALYCSSQQRAQETAAPIALALKMEFQTRDALRKMDFGQ